MDTQVNPYTRDYVLPALPAAELVRDPANGLLNAAYIRLATPLGSWWADPTVGSKLYLLAREKDRPRVAVLAKQYVQQALQPLLADGRCTALDIFTQQPGNGWLKMLITLTAANSAEFTFDHLVKVA